jgi:peptidoglycan/xylan/chitin deacetylase (PgdA/CDA1 family)
MAIPNIIVRIQNRCRRGLSIYLGRRMVHLKSKYPIISFTFDDFPRSALHQGGAILCRHGVRGTYYTSLGLMGHEMPAGAGFLAGDLQQTVAEGHELGCHTFAHCHAWKTKPSNFEESIIKNRQVLAELLPEVAFKTLSYPIDCPHPQIKRRAAKYFACCRGGGRSLSAGFGDGNKSRNPAFNVGPTDINNLQTYFLEKSRDNPQAIKDLIDENCRVQGWLIFATHDVCFAPSPYGCTPDFFEDIVSYAVNSGSRILPVGKAWDLINVNWT